MTNVRLGAYNGLHLVLASRNRSASRAIVYSDEREPGLAREAQQAGAFYEVGTRLPVTLATYFTGTLPVHDRRSPAAADRRGLFRGGRRSWELHLESRPR